MLAKKTMALFFCLLDSCLANSRGISLIWKFHHLSIFPMLRVYQRTAHFKSSSACLRFLFYETKKKLSWNFIASLKRSCSFIIMIYFQCDLTLTKHFPPKISFHLHKNKAIECTGQNMTSGARLPNFKPFLCHLPFAYVTQGDLLNSSLGHSVFFCPVRIIIVSIDLLCE